ncbi:hypothetical protein [Mesoplasma corruscae]|uniref:Uncharacterized protein n=1 Tax=Mesoplasma corruscae TaxID=216874 RepID=A0A2S5RHC8_9MOLU|nr:hypothetical protein [Mesoplasma corruscae]PPE06736.1 hypothetical protein MCORR_v1c03670 [Mesoplasma corruscae]
MIFLLKLKKIELNTRFILENKKDALVGDYTTWCLHHWLKTWLIEYAMLSLWGKGFWYSFREKE